MASMNTRTCILHIDKTSCQGEVKPFDEKTWAKVNKCDSTRHSTSHGKGTPSKYLSINIPVAFDDSIGYHVDCYRKFTAIRCSADKIETEETKLYTLRSGVSETAGQSSTTGIFTNTCIICTKYVKQTRGKKEFPGKCMTESAAKAFYDAAARLDDRQMLAQISGIDMIAKEVRYHHTCKRNYLNKDKSYQGKLKADTESSEADSAWIHLVDHVQDTIVDSEGAEFLTSLHKRYTDILDEDSAPLEARSLGDRISKSFPQLKFLKRCKKEGTIVFNANLTEDDAIKRASFDHNSIVETAYYLRTLIKDIEKNARDLPKPLTVEAIEKGQAEPPDDLIKFLNVLYTGSTGAVANEKTSRLVKSTSCDILFGASHGRIKTGKHLAMGLGIKSLTGSRKVMNILNHMGHSINYMTAEELETQLATEIQERKIATPDGLLRQAGLMTGVAWDNFDQNTETMSGAGTVHDTVGICYQNVSTGPLTVMEEPCNTGTSEKKKKQERKPLTFTPEDKSLEPYRKKPRMSKFEYTKQHIERPLHITNAEWKDMLWMITMNLHPVPSWTGWNALVTEDPLPIQKIRYMENITLPPTQLNVVLETLKISQKVTEECGQEYAIVTYDLAIAKPAMQIQAEEAPRFDNVFICFGAFHIALAYLGCLGHFIDGSGGPNILTDCGVLATGSQRGFLLGKHYNRCKRLHPLLASAMTKLHFKFFLDEVGGLSEAEVSMLESFSSTLSPTAMEDLEKSEEYFDLMCRYESFCDETLSGQHGATPQFWMIYIDLVRRLLLFIRATRTNDLPMFVYALKQLIPIFFAGNRPNYSRWMVKYLMNLVNCENSHPGITAILEKGALSVRRTQNTFSRTAVDMTLEQTVNADAASRHTGMGSFVSSRNARARWMVTRSVRSAIVGTLLDTAGINRSEDSTKDLLPNRLKKDHDDLECVVASIQSTMNPFSVDVSKELYCLTSGKKANDDIKSDLLGFIKAGDARADEFTEDCLKSPLRFEKPIKRKKVKNFASASVKSKLPVGKTTQEVAGTRDLFGRLLLLSTLENIDLEKVLKFPLTPVPLSLAHTDGSMNTTDKSKLMHKLETFLDNQPVPTETDACIVDAVFFLHQQKNLPMTFGELAKCLLRQLVAISKQVHLVCDTYMSPSIKDTERERRGNNESVFNITGPDQTRPKDWQAALRSSSFKKALFMFLALEWGKSEYVTVLKDCSLYLAVNNTCVSFKADDELIQKNVIQGLQCDHEEADTRMVFHLEYMSVTQNITRVVIRSCDTDVLVILCYYLASTNSNVQVWMDVGRDSNNTRRQISVNTIVNNVTKEVARALPGLHAITGCDYVPAFLNKGKAKPFELVRTIKTFQECMTALGENEVNAVTSEQCEAFVCSLYGQPRETSVNKARFGIFQKVYAPRSLDEPLASIKGVNPSSLPPCASALALQIQRANFVAAMWKRAHMPNPCVGSPVGHGWLMDIDHNTYRMHWYEGDQLPNDIYSALGQVTDGLTEENEDESVSYGESLYGADEMFDDDD